MQKFTYIYSLCMLHLCRVSYWLHENSGRTWLHKCDTLYWSLSSKLTKSEKLKYVKNYFSSSKSHLHIFNVHVLLTKLTIFKIAWKLWEKLLTQTWYPILKHNPKIDYIENAVILSIIIFFFFKKSHVHLQYACNICAKFQIDCLKTLRYHKLATLYWSLTSQLTKSIMP